VEGEQTINSEVLYRSTKYIKEKKSYTVFYYKMRNIPPLATRTVKKNKASISCISLKKTYNEYKSIDFVEKKLN